MVGPFWLQEYEMPWCAGEEVAFVLRLIGVPTVAVSLAFDIAPFVSGGRMVFAGCRDTRYH
jgi:hypothetical protein